MSEEIKGLYIEARERHTDFQVKFIGKLAFGVVDEGTTDKKYVELCCPEYENQVQQLQAENESRLERLVLLDGKILDMSEQIEQLQAENETLKEALSKINILNADKDGDIKWLIEQAFKETKQ